MKTYYKKKTILFVLLICFSVVLAGCNNKPSTIPKNEYVKIVYEIVGNGSLIGPAVQEIKKGQDADGVTAIPNADWRFIGWSDGCLTQYRKDKSIKEDFTVKALFEKDDFILTYDASEGGYIVGETEQRILRGGDSSTVEAVANEGYLFNGWSDGVITNPRQEKNVQNKLSVQANFIKSDKTFTYEYNGATSNNTQDSITLTYDTISQTTFIIPNKVGFDFAGWYLEPNLKTKAADATGKLYLGYGIFHTETNKLYAKWVSKKSNEYKILLVFVDEIHAIIDNIVIDYKMPLVERKLCELIPGQIEKYLNNWFDGLAYFKVDAYFTTTPLGYENFSGGKKDYYIMADNITEVGSIMKDYHSVITTFAMKDYNEQLHSAAGLGSTKYASIYLDNFIKALSINNLPIESLFNLSDSKAKMQWSGFIETYLHEFAHTIEQEYYNFHKALGYCLEQGLSNLESIRLYLLNQININGKLVGIPISFWHFEVNVWVNYVADIGGKINGENSIVRQVPYGSDMQLITAVPNEGYKFVKWSDGVMTATRNDKDIISYLNVKAIFATI